MMMRWSQNNCKNNRNRNRVMKKADNEKREGMKRRKLLEKNAGKYLTRLELCVCTCLCVCILALYTLKRWAISVTVSVWLYVFALMFVYLDIDAHMCISAILKGLVSNYCSWKYAPQQDERNGRPAWLCRFRYTDSNNTTLWLVNMQIVTRMLSI